MKQIAMMHVPFRSAQIGKIRELAALHGYSLSFPDPKSPDDVVKDAEILCGYFPHRMLRAAKNLKWLALPSAGADKYVAEDIYAGRDVILTNSSGAFGKAIAEQLLMGTLMLLRNMPGYQAQQRQKVWNRMGDLRFLFSSRVVVLGTGNLGSTFARYAKTMGAKVIGVNRSGSAVDDAFDEIYPVSALCQAVSNADVVAACLPLTAMTQGLIDRTVFAAMENHPVFLNVGRGKTVVQQDLIEALQSGVLSGAMIDVAEEEPMGSSCILWEMENVIITPHISGSDLDPENAEQIFTIFYDNLVRWFEGKPLENIVDKTKGY